MLLGVMTNQTDTQADAIRTRKLTAISKDGKWKSFLGVPGLMQYIPSGQFFARAKVGRIVKRASLETDTFTTAKDRLPLKVALLRKPPAAPVELGTFQTARLAYLADIESDHALSEETKQYWNWRIAALLKSWPALDTMKLSAITLEQCRAWGKRFAAEFEATNFNNTLSAFRSILKRGGLGKDEKTNFAFALSRLGAKLKELTLPETKQFEKLVVTIATSGAGKSRHCADLVEFLAYSGCRISEARKVTWQDVNLERNEIRVHNAKRSKTSAASNVRFVPIIPPMRRLLERLKVQNHPKRANRVCILSECQKSLDRGCKIVRCPRITHHDLRHLFASICIESGVDIPSVSRWLGHVDGGALAMKVYGHLRRSHSQGMAALVTFGQTVALPSKPKTNQKGTS
jgi:integrase